MMLPLMSTPVNSPASLPPPLWKRVIIRALVGGAACGVVVSIAFGGLYFYTQHPKEWDKKAVQAATVKAVPLSRLNDKFEEVGTGVAFTIDLENTRSEDMTISQSVTIMQEDKASHALHGSFLKLDRDVFIPSHHAVSMSLDASDLCVAKYDPQTCFNTYFQDDSYIVLLDNSLKYEIRIPMPKLTIPSGQRIELPK